MINEKNDYENEIMKKCKDIEDALKYYIDRNKELENENKIYKDMYEKRVNEYLKNNNKSKEDLGKYYMDNMTKAYEKYKKDNEELHIMCDDYLLDLLEELGFVDIVKLYKKIKEECLFWYA